jgi:hypothetical protein
MYIFIYILYVHMLMCIHMHKLIYSYIQEYVNVFPYMIIQYTIYKAETLLFANSSLGVVVLV